MTCKTFLIITENQQVLQRRAILVSVLFSLSGIKQLTEIIIKPEYVTNVLINGMTSSTDELRLAESSNNLPVAPNDILIRHSALKIKMFNMTLGR